MKSGILMTVAVFATSAAAAAQTVPPPAQPTPQSSQVTVESRRDAMHVMEGVLTASVRSGAAQLTRRIQAIAPSLMILSGEAHARGFLIEGYGVFFDVEVPDINPAVVWSVQTLSRDRGLGESIAQLRQFVSAISDPGARQQAEEALHQVEQQVGPIPASQHTGTAVAASTDTTAPAQPPVPDIGDPNEEYTKAVKDALVDAMLDYSASMKIGPDEWLTVAASSSSGPMMPGQVYDAPTTILRVKGSDLSAYQTGKVSREDVLKKVEIREF